jgi:hypothetical protein
MQTNKLNNMENSITKTFQPLINDILKGRTIVAARYMSKQEAEDMYWDSRPLVIHLDNGTLLFMSRDDEGNDGGALFYQTKEKQTDGKFTIVDGRFPTI